MRVDIGPCHVPARSWPPIGASTWRDTRCHQGTFSLLSARGLAQCCGRKDAPTGMKGAGPTRGRIVLVRKGVGLGLVRFMCDPPRVDSAEYTFTIILTCGRVGGSLRDAVGRSRRPGRPNVHPRAARATRPPPYCRCTPALTRIADYPTVSIGKNINFYEDPGIFRHSVEQPSRLGSPSLPHTHNITATYFPPLPPSPRQPTLAPPARTS